MISRKILTNSLECWKFDFIYTHKTSFQLYKHIFNKVFYLINVKNHHLETGYNLFIYSGSINVYLIIKKHEDNHENIQYMYNIPEKL